RHHDAAAVGRIPGLVGLDAARGFPVVPLVAGVVGVVGGGDRLHDPVDFDVLDVRVGGQLAHQRLGLAGAQLLAGDQHVGADRGAAQLLEPQRLPVQGAVGGRVERAVQGRGAGALGAALAVLDDEAV